MAIGKGTGLLESMGNGGRNGLYGGLSVEGVFALEIS